MLSTSNFLNKIIKKSGKLLTALGERRELVIRKLFYHGVLAIAQSLELIDFRWKGFHKEQLPRIPL